MIPPGYMLDVKRALAVPLDAPVAPAAYGARVSPSLHPGIYYVMSSDNAAVRFAQASEMRVDGNGRLLEVQVSPAVPLVMPIATLLQVAASVGDCVVWFIPLVPVPLP